VDLSGARCVIIVLGQDGCPACAEYEPVFRRVAASHARIPIAVLNIDSTQGTALADAYDVEATPTTLLLRRPVGAIRAQGAISDAALDRLFQFAETL